MASKQLIVELIDGSNLVAADIGGSSDPYVRLRVGSQEFKSKTIKHSLNPTWNERFEFTVHNEHEESLELEVWDRDRIGADDPIGRSRVRLARLVPDWSTSAADNTMSQHSFDLPLQLLSVSHGTIHIRLTAIGFTAIPSNAVQGVLIHNGVLRIQSMDIHFGSQTLNITDYDSVGASMNRPIPLALNEMIDTTCHFVVAAENLSNIKVDQIITFEETHTEVIRISQTWSGPFSSNHSHIRHLEPIITRKPITNTGIYRLETHLRASTGTELAHRTLFFKVLQKQSGVEKSLKELRWGVPFNRAVVMGPVLLFAGVEHQRDSGVSLWKTSALMVTRHLDHTPTTAPPSLQIVAAQSTRDVLVERVSLHVMRDSDGGVVDTESATLALWRFNWSIPQTGQVLEVSYETSFDGEHRTFRYVVPALASTPVMVNISCNGYHDPATSTLFGSRLEAMWQNMLDVHHRVHSIHLLLQGGDQMYADGMIQRLPELRGWEPRLPLTLPQDEQFRARLMNIYFRMYCEHWSLPLQAETFASIPSLMMWDDHDIFDGWGSFESAVQDSPAYRLMYSAARKNFSLFQLGLACENDFPPGAIGIAGTYMNAHVLGHACVLNLDLRSERSIDQVISQESYDKLNTFLNTLTERNRHLPEGEKPVRHMFVVSSIPVMYADFRAVEAVMSIVPSVLPIERFELEDDLRDHWRSPHHAVERVQFLTRLFAFAREAACRVTLLSGDVHLACMGVIEDHSPVSTARRSNANNIIQLITSPMLNAPTSGSSLLMSEYLCKGVDRITDTMNATMIKLPGQSSYLVSARNYLLLETRDETAAVNARLYLENKPTVAIDILPVAEGNEPEFVVSK